MKFRFRAFALHALGSACVLSLVFGALYLGWYRWPGWYITGAVHVSAILAGVDVTLGPLVTLLIANPKKPRRALARDIAVIVVFQLAAMTYGVATLWNGRPLYYAFSAVELEMVPAAEVPANEIALAWQQNPEFAPHWYSVPRWVFVPLPPSEADRKRIAESAAADGLDVTRMPQYFRPWSQAGETLRSQLKRVDQFSIFTRQEKQLLKQRMAQQGFAPDQPVTLFLVGRDRPVLAVFDRTTLNLRAIIRGN